MNMSRMAQERLDLGPIVPLLTRIDERYHPEQVWLFGSRARGDARRTSDWDLFVVVPDHTEEAALEPSEVWDLKKGLKGVYADVIPCRASDFREWKDTVNTLSYSVATEG